MEKKRYMKPVTGVCKLESISMLAGSPMLSVCEDEALKEIEVLSNQNVWTDGLW